jgi:hypothetical protein
MKVNYKNIKVERGVPIPPLTPRNLFSTLDEMGIGDSFGIELVEFDSVMDGISNYELTDTGKDNKEFLVDGQHLRVWRTK